MSGVDYLRIRADGRITLDIRAVIATATARVPLASDGGAASRANARMVDLYRTCPHRRCGTVCLGERPTDLGHRHGQPRGRQGSTSVGLMT